MSEILLCGLRALFVYASFAGLCVAIRARFGIDRFIAPLTAAGCAILFLMAAGMLGLLFPGVCALYALGFAGWFYARFSKRRVAPCWPLLLAGALLLVFLSWRLARCRYNASDDFSHWGLVARHLLLHDRFPNRGDVIIAYTSYPLGATCFIYYFARFIGFSEFSTFLAQNFLQAVLLLPLFSLIRPQRRTLYPAVAALFLCFYCYCFVPVNLQVDVLLSHFGIGMAAAAIRYRRDFRRACIAVLPAMLAAVYVKSSGAFFALCTAAMLICSMKLSGRFTWRRALVIAAAPLLAYGLWMLFIRLHLPGAQQSKHAVSLSGYAAHFAGTSAATLRQIAKGVLVRFFRGKGRQRLALLVALVCLPVLFASARRLPRAARRRYLGALLAVAAAYLLWYLLLLCMYLFSMPEAEALALRSIDRYDSTGYVYAAGVAVALTLAALGGERGRSRAALRLGAALSAASLAAAVLLVFAPGHPTALSDIRVINPLYHEIHTTLVTLRAEHDLSTDGSYLIYTSTDYHSGYLYDLCKYELEAKPLALISDSLDNPGLYTVTTGYEDIRETDDVEAYLAETMDAADALLVLDESPEFERHLANFLSGYAGDTPVYRGGGVAE